MKSVDLNSNWSVAVGDEHFTCDFPYDVTVCAARDYSCAFGANNGYIPAQKAVFTRALPQIKRGVSLRISGACGYGAAYVNDERVGTLGSYGPHTFFVPGGLPCAHNTVRIELTTSPEMSDKYIGLGVAGGVELVTGDDGAEIEYRSLFVKTVRVNDRIYAETEMYLCNNGDSADKFVLECTALNARGKRAGKKQKKISLQPHIRKAVTVRVRINNPYEWSENDPYMYTMSVRLISSGGAESAETVRFGLVARALNKARGLYLNKRRVKLFGAYLSHADSAVGSASVYINERRRLEKLKSLGYNAVHFIDCPTDAMLDACDDAGLYAYVDLFPYLGTAHTTLGGIFNDGYYAVTERVLSLRNHPSVTLYGVADDVPECYDRNDGHEFIRILADGIRDSDNTRPVTVSAREFVPTVKELDEEGVKRAVASESAAINAGREKHLFETRTAGAFANVDVCGLNYLYALYDERGRFDKPIVGSRSSAEHAFDSIDAAEKNDSVIGDFNDCGMDYPGGGKLNEIYTDNGDIDAVGQVKPQGVYKSILLGARNVAYIVAVDPESGERVQLWNWPRYLGQRIKVCVYTSGDVVALYLNGKIAGRRLAGRVNRHIATFDIDYYPGTLEAVSYFKGVECARTTLKSAAPPKTISLSAYSKNLSVSRGDLGFVDICVCDRDGTPVPYAMRELTATVTGGTLVNLINADPLLRKSAHDVCPAFGGRALAVIKPDPGENKTVVKITGDGLLSSRISFKIKN